MRCSSSLEVGAHFWRLLSCTTLREDVRWCLGVRASTASTLLSPPPIVAFAPSRFRTPRSPRVPPRPGRRKLQNPPRLDFCTCCCSCESSERTSSAACCSCSAPSSRPAMSETASTVPEGVADAACPVTELIPSLPLSLVVASERMDTLEPADIERACAARFLLMPHHVRPPPLCARGASSGAGSAIAGVGSVDDAGASTSCSSSEALDSLSARASVVCTVALSEYRAAASRAPPPRFPPHSTIANVTCSASAPMYAVASRTQRASGVSRPRSPPHWYSVSETSHGENRLLSAPIPIPPPTVASYAPPSPLPVGIGVARSTAAVEKRCTSSCPPNPSHRSVPIREGAVAGVTCVRSAAAPPLRPRGRRFHFKPT
mmetsp:Transcript_2139/g.8511  ORF Transcript_2139/g.8511 Transcript_2139/m.8511 type:complete len:374 (+) Transcript_2139:734-1855(+)